MSNSREQLEKELHNYCDGDIYTEQQILEWCNRQAAITRAECDAEIQEWRDGTIIAKWTEAEHARDYWKAACQQRDIDHDKATKRLAVIWKKDRDEWKAKAERTFDADISYACQSVGIPIGDNESFDGWFRRASSQHSCKGISVDGELPASKMGGTE